MKRISVKFGFYFFICTFLIESILFLLLYYSLVNTRVQEEVKSLLARGNNHRDVLEKYFDNQTISHVALMESEAETKVVITSKTGEILAKSSNVDASMEKHLYTNMPDVSKNGAVAEDHWKTSNYICTISPIQIGNDIKGYVYMFLGTDSIKQMIQRLTYQFIVVGAITFILTIITMFLLSRILTNPLIRMKKATEKMSKGDLSVSLNINGNDEVGELAHSIQKLADDLNYIKKERGEFLASVAHELRTPLTYIRGYADIVLKTQMSTQDQNHYLSIIKEEADHVTRLVQDLFALAKMEKHNFIINTNQTNLYDLLKNILTKIQPAYTDKNIRIIFSCPEDLILLLDEQRFEQVMLNLLNNAYSHSSINSKVFVTVIENKENVKIIVKDEGEGIPQQDLSHIFERFYRVDKSRTRATGGSGLGLAIVKEIIELHEGSISVESELGHGTIFTILLKK
ncbi:HAMP domain-containing sensor histidine kinase [Bacillus sp. DX4.1]|uniref:sensor histidine kinase n=1 Tax=Bacillus sp. DX4.1 TaxID=3055867 RepID=UPI0025A00422|nr:HAMP domain-containing sensor histidine kinase [Bacillus sp. DX4.1]MDM5188153.1 HAMP domain-containing sensor histidine kinase [Bacillus sp. DX4.1]